MFNEKTDYVQGIKRSIVKMCYMGIIDDSVDLYWKQKNVMLQIFCADFNPEIGNDDEIDIEFNTVESYKAWCGFDIDEDSEQEFTEQFKQDEWYSLEGRLKAMNDWYNNQPNSTINGIKV